MKQRREGWGIRGYGRQHEGIDTDKKRYPSHKSHTERTVKIWQPFSLIRISAPAAGSALRSARCRLSTRQMRTPSRMYRRLAGLCIRCGHCEVSCPSQALFLDFLPGERVQRPAFTGAVSAGDLGAYLKKRRSVRHFTREPVPREKILRVLDIARYALRAATGSRSSGSSCTIQKKSTGSPGCASTGCRPYKIAAIP